MKLKFKFVNEGHIDVIGISEGKNVDGAEEGTEKKIGQIFTPSGSANNTLNAIQICGFHEAFDLWGCGVFGHPFQHGKGMNLDWNKTHQAKDIQLAYNWETERMGENHLDKCHKCFNEPCTCEVHINFENPYTVKRENDLNLQKKELNKKQ